MQQTDKTIHCECCQSLWKRKSDFTNHCKTAKHLKNKSVFLQQVEEIPPPAPFEFRFLEENAPDEKNMKPSHAVIVDIPVNMDDSINQTVTIIEDKHEESAGFIEYIRTQIIRIIKISISLIPGVNIVLGRSYQRYKNY
jgi:hypothetical protein